MTIYPAYSNILQFSHFDRLIIFLETYPAIAGVTSPLFSSRTLSTMSCVLSSEMPLSTVVYLAVYKSFFD